MNYIHSRAGRMIPAMAMIAMLSLTACESPVEPGLLEAPVLVQSGSALLADSTYDALIMNEDGSVTPYVETTGATPGGRGIARLITGVTTYDRGQVSEFRLNVRQDAAGNYYGDGRVTIQGHTTDFTPLCIKENPGFGDPFYGVTVRLADPLPYFGHYREYVTISVTNGGNMSTLILSNDTVCRVSALRYPYEPTTGTMKVTH